MLSTAFGCRYKVVQFITIFVNQTLIDELWAFYCAFFGEDCTALYCVHINQKWRVTLVSHWNSLNIWMINYHRQYKRKTKSSIRYEYIKYQIWAIWYCHSKFKRHQTFLITIIVRSRTYLKILITVIHWHLFVKNSYCDINPYSCFQTTFHYTQLDHALNTIKSKKTTGLCEYHI